MEWLSSVYSTKNSQEYPRPPNPPPGTYQVSKRNTLSYIKRKLIPILQ